MSAAATPFSRPLKSALVLPSIFLGISLLVGARDLGAVFLALMTGLIDLFAVSAAMILLVRDRHYISMGNIVITLVGAFPLGVALLIAAAAVGALLR